MAKYRVSFFKNLVSSDGHPFKVLQRVVAVARSQSPEDAVRAAQHRFEHLEGVPDWKLHADSIEIEEANEKSSRR